MSWSRSWASSLLIVALVGCPKPTPPEPVPGEAAIDRALLLAGRDRASLELPRAAEAGYFVPTSYPWVDGLLARPLALPPEAERLGAKLDRVARPSELLGAVRVAGPGGTDHRTMPPPAPSEATPTLPDPMTALGSERGRLLTAHLPPSFSLALADVVAAAQIHEHAQRTLLADLEPPRRAAEEYFVDPFGGGLRFRSHPVGVQLEFLEASRVLRQGLLTELAIETLVRIEDTLPELREAAAELPPSSGYLLHLETSLGPVIVGSTGPDQHTDHARLRGDPGGDDRGGNNAGSNVGVPGAVGVAIDLGGRDRYSSGRDHVQGAGYGGLGILIDLGEEPDDYLAGSQSQGAGFYGVGVLWDEGGDDARQAAGHAQGAGTFGVGVLLDGGGNDRAAVQGRGQGFGSTGGLGVFADLGGDDQLRLGVAGEDINGPLGGAGQGCGMGTRSFPWVGDSSLHGGVGLLYDRAGDDGYYARADGQGAGWMLGVGMLLDRAGDDRYVAEHRGQGSATHLAAGLLVDGGGADTYEGTNTVQGAAVDRSVGILWDRGDGGDTYGVHVTGGALPRELGGGQGWARKAHALAILADDGGDDRYRPQWDGLGFVVPPARPDRGATALVIDLGGSDDYLLAVRRPGANPADGATWLHGDLGVGQDTFEARPGWDHEPLTGVADGFSWSGGSVPREPFPEPAPGDPEGDATARWLAAEALYRAALSGDSGEPPEWVRTAALTDPSPPVRRASARVLAASGDVEGVDVLVDSLVYQSEDNWDRPGFDTVRLWLHLLTDLDVAGDAEQWRGQWRAIRDGFDLKARMAPLLGFERAQRASARRDTATLVAACEEAVALPEGRAVQRPCATLVGLWAWVLSHPESHAFHDPERAVELGQLAVRWAPDQSEHFVHLARAFWLTGQRELAERALEKAVVLDPDGEELVKLKRRMEEEQPP